jgi:hypothetical protein
VHLQRVQNPQALLDSGNLGSQFGFKRDRTYDEAHVRARGMLSADDARLTVALRGNDLGRQSPEAPLLRSVLALTLAPD